MIYIIYMAAGNSRRFGSNKLLYSLEGKALYRYGLDCLRQVCSARDDCRLILVSQYPEILQQAESLGARILAQEKEDERERLFKDHRFFGVYSPDSIHGASYTIQAGLGLLPALQEEDAMLFMVADQPYIKVETLYALMDAMPEGSADTARAACACYQGRRGNPVIFSAAAYPALMSLVGDQGGKRVLKQCQVKELEVSDEIELIDYDTLEEIEKSSSIAHEV